MLVQGAEAIERLQDGDKVLISEGCTHHRQCDDIGSVKIPHWLKSYTGKQLEIEFSSGMEFPEELSEYKLIIHCGGCMLNEREMKYRLKCAGIRVSQLRIMGLQLHICRKSSQGVWKYSSKALAIIITSCYS